MEPSEVADVLDKAGSQRVLRHLLAHPTIPQREFTAISRMSPDTARELRDRLEEMGILKVRHLSRTLVEIRLTPTGAEIVRRYADALAFAVEKLAKSPSEKK